MSKRYSYYVQIGSVILYSGRSEELPAQYLQMAINIMRTVGGTGTIAYYTPDTKGQYDFINGKQKGVEG